MKLAILSIGDELMCGEIVDTNFAQIASILYTAGLKVSRHLTVGDDESDIAAALHTLAEDHEVIITTGGLGPTSDDRTSAAVATATGHPLQLSPEALLHVRRVTEMFGGEMPPANEKQALIPEGALLIPNPIGTACGFQLPLSDCRLFFLPGVPREMSRMLNETVMPALLAGGGERIICRTRVLKVFGPSEAELDTLLEGLAPPGSGVSVAFCVDFPEIHVRLRAEGENRQDVDATLQEAATRARGLLKTSLFAEEHDTIDAVVARLLTGKGVTLSVAESCTGGLLAKRLTDIAGSSAYFLEGAVTYSNEAKKRILHISSRLLEEKGAVSSEVALAMAAASRYASGSDFALAVTGIAGPDGGTPGKPVGTVFIALADRAGTESRSYRFAGDRDEIRTITSFAALDWLRLRLMA